MRRAQRIYIGSAIVLALVGRCVWLMRATVQDAEKPTSVTRNPKMAKRREKVSLAAIASRAAAAVNGVQKPLTEVVITDRLPPTTAGPALAICDPIAFDSDSHITSDSRTAAFGAGCTRWLQYAMFSYPQLGQMMRWSEQERAMPELGVANLRLSARQAPLFGRMIGCTHVAVSNIAGTPARYTLTLHVEAVPGNAATGSAATDRTCTITGSEAQIVAGLPQLAQQLLARVGIQASAPQAPALTANELSTIGSYDWWATSHPSVELQRQMQALKQRDALAGMLFMLHNSGKEEDYRLLFTQAPTNLEARAECLQLFDYLTPAMRQEVIKGFPPLPNNALVAQSRVDNARLPQELVRAAEHLVQCAPRNPESWVSLETMYSQVSEHLRAARSASQISSGEWKALHRLYAHELSAAEKAATLDPLFGKAWNEIAVSATFAGKPSEADKALWKAIQLNRGNAQPYFWGLEMYQPKWFSDAAKLDKVAKLAVVDKSLTLPDRDKLATKLKTLGYVTEAQQLEAQANSGR